MSKLNNVTMISLEYDSEIIIKCTIFSLASKRKGKT